MTETSASARRNSGKSPDSKHLRAGLVYARVAVDPPDDFALERQVEACAQIAERHGITVTGAYADSGASGLRQERPQYRQMLDDLRVLRPDALITWNLDRLGRSPAVIDELLEVLEQSGTTLYTADGRAGALVPVGVFSARLLAAALERETMPTAGKAVAT